MWKNGRTAIMRSCSATWCTQAVWGRLATRLRCVSTTPLGNPVVPLEYGSTARSRAGSTGARGADAPVSSRVANGVAPGAARPPPAGGLSVRRGAAARRVDRARFAPRARPPREPEAVHQDAGVGDAGRRALEEQAPRERTPRGGRGKTARTATPPSCL